MDDSPTLAEAISQLRQIKAVLDRADDLREKDTFDVDYDLVTPIRAVLD